MPLVLEVLVTVVMICILDHYLMSKWLRWSRGVLHLTWWASQMNFHGTCISSVMELKFVLTRSECFLNSRVIQLVFRLSFSPVYGTEFNLTSYIGRLTYDSDGNITGAAASLMNYVINFNVSVVDGEEVRTPVLYYPFRSHIRSGLLQGYHQTSNIRHTKSQNLNVSHHVLQLPLPNPLKPGVKSRMKM